MKGIGPLVGSPSMSCAGGLAWGDASRQIASPIALSPATTIMSLETARNLSIPDLLCLLNEKLGLGCTRLQETPFPLAVSVASLESEVSEPQSTHLNDTGDDMV